MSIIKHMSTTLETKRSISFEEAKRRFINRYTMEHKPSWADFALPKGRKYAPSYRTDREWYDNTYFHGEHEAATYHHCYSTNQSFPLGKWLTN